MAETEIKLTPEQQAALDLMLAGKNVFLTGETERENPQFCTNSKKLAEINELLEYLKS